MISLYQSGLISAEAALEELRAQGRELGVFSNLTLPADDIPEGSSPVNVSHRVIENHSEK